ncbi:hypothetical protein Hanom_Chr16g01499341 [Helianthus anomalus]
MQFRIAIPLLQYLVSGLQSRVIADLYDLNRYLFLASSRVCFSSSSSVSSLDHVVLILILRFLTMRSDTTC